MSRPMTLLFVNKTSDSKSLSRSVGHEKQRIFSHVQQGQARDATSAVPVYKWWVDSDRENESGSDGSSSTTRKPSSALGRQRKAVRKGEGATAGPTDPQARAMREVRVRQKPSIPFALEFNPETLADSNGVARSYLATTLGFFRSLFAQAMFSSPMAARSTLTVMMGYAAQSLAARNALLCGIASTLSLISSDPSHDEHAVYFKGIALYRLRKQVCSDTVRRAPSPTLCAISMLLWTELIQGNFDHVAAHLAGLHQVLSLVNIGEQLSFSETPAVFGISNLCSVMQRTPPLPPPVASDSYAIQRDLDAYVSRQLEHTSWHVESGFFTVGTARLIGPRLLELAARQKARCLFRDSRRFEGMDTAHADYQGLAYEAMRTDYELLSPAQKVCDLATESIRDVVRLCLFLVTQPMVGQMAPSSGLNRSIAKQLCDGINKSDIDSLLISHSDLLLWVFFVTAYCTEPGAQWLWLMEKIRQLFIALGISSEEEFEQAVDEFIFAKTLFAGLLKRVWSDAHSTIAREGTESRERHAEFWVSDDQDAPPVWYQNLLIDTLD